jgi:hypothetical protein
MGSAFQGLAGLFDGFPIFLIALISHFVTLLAGFAAAGILVTIGWFFLDRPISFKGLVRIFGFFVFFAGFQAWHEQYQTAQMNAPLPPPASAALVQLRNQPNQHNRTKHQTHAMIPDARVGN